MRKNELLSTTFYVPSKAHKGYTLFAPMRAKLVWLIDMQGRIVHCWKTPYLPGSNVVLLPNGNLLYAGKVEDGPLKEFGGAGGVLIELDWDSNEIWRYEEPFMHHDFWRMDNGNTMVLRWEAAPDDIAAKVKGGVPGTERKGIIWVMSFHEIDRDGKIIWEWNGYEHLDPETDVICPLCHRAEWDHANSCVVLPDGNIMTNCRILNSILIIDKNTGEIKWRWGQGELAHPHNASLLDNGHILVFDNGLHRALSTTSYSRVLEIEQETGKIVWEYKDPIPVNFYSSNISGCQRLPNGNTLICEGPKGRFFEVTKNGEIVWEYISPFFYDDPNFGLTNMVFRSHRYDPEYPGLKGVELDPRSFDLLNRIYGPDGFKY